MNRQVTNIEVEPGVAEIIQALKAKAETLGISLEVLLRPLAEETTGLLEEKPFDETATPDDLADAFLEWANSHDPQTPVILDDRRESIYGDDAR